MTCNIFFFFHIQIPASSLLDTNICMQHFFPTNPIMRIERQRNVSSAFWEIVMYFNRALWEAECCDARFTNTHRNKISPSH